jgi:histidinol-phosphatase (PHP family)
MYDMHIHSQYSMDSTTDMEDIVIQAIKKNMKSICFTDHVDFDSTLEKIDFVFRTSDYFRDINRVKYKYKKDIEILAGVEIGIQAHLFERYKEFINNNMFDFVLMSIHSVKRQDIYVDNFTKDRNPSEALDEYYSDMLTCVRGFSNFDVLGHIDYIDRYFSSKEDIPDFEIHKDIIRQILKTIIQKGKGIELNTSGFRKDLGYFHPKLEILKLYKSLGGEIITIGSDAHTAHDVGSDYKLAEKMLRDLGFKLIHIFKDRKKFPINIL